MSGGLQHPIMTSRAVWRIAASNALHKGRNAEIDERLDSAAQRLVTNADKAKASGFEEAYEACKVEIEQAREWLSKRTIAETLRVAPQMAVGSGITN